MLTALHNHGASHTVVHAGSLKLTLTVFRHVALRCNEVNALGQ